MPRLFSCVLLSLLVASSVIGWPSWSHATPLLVGSTPTPATGEPDPVGGTLLASLGPAPFATSGFSGTLASAVYSNDSTNPWGPSALTFTYLLTNNLASTGSIHHIEIYGWGADLFDATFLTDASYQVPTDGIPPTLLDRFYGNRVDFRFGPADNPTLHPGDTSALLVLQTNSTSYKPYIAQVYGQQGIAFGVPTFAPMPEPGTGLLVIAGLLGIAGWRRARE